MKTHIIVSSLACAITCLGVNPAWAAPPIEQIDPQSAGYEKQLDEAVKNMKRNANAKALAKRKGPLYFLTIEEKTRIEAVDQIVVPIEPLQPNDAAQALADACAVAPTARALASSTAAPTRSLVLTNNDLASGKFSQELLALEPLAVPGRTAANETLRQHAEIVDDVCKGIRDKNLTPEHVEFLRAVLGDHLDELKVFSGLAKQASNPSFDLFSSLHQTLGTGQSLAASTALTGIATTAFEGLAEFLIDRAKEEVLSFVKDEFVTKICEADPGVFIPETCAALESLDSSMAVSAMGATLHASAVDDLAVLPDRLLVLAWQKDEDVAYPGTVLRATMPLFTKDKARRNPLEYVASLYLADAIDCESTSTTGAGDKICGDVMAGLRLSSAVLRIALESELGSTTNIANEHKAIAQLFALETAINGMPEKARKRLKAASDASVKWSTWSPTDTTLQFDSATINTTTQRWDDVMDAAAELEALYDGLRTASMTDQEVDILPLVQDTVEMLTTTLVSLDLVGPAHPLGTHLQGIDSVVELVSDIQREDWAQAVRSTIRLVQYVVNTAAASKTVAAGEVQQDIDVLARYIGVIAEIANADSSADVNAILQAAFPAGGYKRKYLEPSVAINGFLGVYGGGIRHWQLGADNKVDQGQLTPEFALFAPIGVHLTGPVGTNAKRPHYLGALLGVLDLGAITTSKWLEQEVNPKRATLDENEMPDMGTVQTELTEPAKINFAGLVSPGAYLTWGIARSPFVLGAGASFVPFAQKRTNTERDSAGDIEATDERHLTAIRFGVFLAVDITFASFGLGGKRR